MPEAILRRFTTIDAMIMIAATAVALLPASVIWEEAFAIIRNVGRDISESGFQGIFDRHPQNEPTDSIGMMGQYSVVPLIGLQWVFRLPGPRQTLIEIRTRGGLATGYAAAQEAYILVFPFLVCWSAALLFLRLRRQRPTRGVLWREPGWWACVVATIVLIAGAYVETYIGYRVPTVVVPTAVLVAWLTLWASAKWSAENSWVDRLGRCLGLGWIALIPLYLVGFVQF